MKAVLDCWFITAVPMDCHDLRLFLVLLWSFHGLNQMI